MHYNFILPSFSNQSSIFHCSSLFDVILKYLLKTYLYSYRQFLAILLIVSFSLSTQALTSQTLNIINGNAPYLTFDGGHTKVINTEGLFEITLSNGTKITPTTNNSLTTPIELPKAGETLADIDMLVPIDSDSITLNTLISPPYNYWGDDDGDGSPTATGNLNLTITDKDNQTVSRNTTLDICKAPYKITLTSTDAVLTTHYGIPNSQMFSAGNATYYINPKGGPLVCFARPHLRLGKDEYGSTHDFRGPDTMWNPDKGFIPQSTTSYDLNFPTTGANGLYFDLEIGASSGSLTWESVSPNNDITAMMTSNSSGSIVRVTLEGPAVTDQTQWESDTPNTIGKPDLPQAFELVGRDSNNNEVVKYGFVLKQWYVNRGTKTYDYTNTKSWCEKLKYRLPQVKDLTNSACTGNGPNEYCKGAVGAEPRSLNNYYGRIIGAGFFSEWGFMSYYTNSNFGNHGYWTSDISQYSGNKPFDVYSYDGAVGWNYPAIHGAYGLCVLPLLPETPKTSQ